MRKLILLTSILYSVVAISQPNNGYLSLNGDTNLIDIKLKKNIGPIDKTIEFFFETCDNQTSTNKAGLLKFPVEGLSVSLTVNTSGNAANFHIEKATNQNASVVLSAPIYRHNSWNHFALCYHGFDSTISLFFNGDSLGSADSMKINTNRLFIGSKSTSFFKGNIDEVRISDGCIYSNSYVVPSALSADRSTDNLFLFDAFNQVNKYISLGNSIDTATIFGNIAFIEKTDITPDTIVCKGDSLALSASGGSNYKWTSNNYITNDTIDSPSIYALDSDTVSVRIENANGCFSNKSVSVIVENLPQVRLGNDTTICSGDLIVLKSGSFSSYLWSTGETDSSIQSNEDTVWVSVKNALGCSNSDTILINKFPEIKLNLGPDTLLQTGFAIKIGAPNYFTNYRWSTGEKTDSILVTLPLTYTLVVTDSNGCIASDEIIVAYPPIGVSENKNRGFSIFPNPSSGIFNLRFERPPTNIEVKLINSLGEVVYSKSIFGSGNLGLVIPIEIPNGVYLLSVNMTEQQHSLPFILQR